MHKTINGWTKKAMIERLYEKNNGKKATMHNEPQACLYEARDGNRCAAGCFFPDNSPALKYEGTIGHILSTFPGLSESMPLNGHGMRSLQVAHDSYNEDGDIRVVLKEWIETYVEDNV